MGFTLGFCKKISVFVLGECCMFEILVLRLKWELACLWTFIFHRFFY